MYNSWKDFQESCTWFLKESCKILERFLTRFSPRSCKIFPVGQILYSAYPVHRPSASKVNHFVAGVKSSPFTSCRTVVFQEFLKGISAAEANYSGTHRFTFTARVKAHIWSSYNNRFHTHTFRVSKSLWVCEATRIYLMHTLLHNI